MQYKYYIQASVAKFFLFSYRLAGIRVGSYLGSWLGRALGRVLPEGRLASKNLALAFPELSDVELRQISSNMWGNLGRLIGDFPHMSQIVDQADARFEYDGLEHLQAAIASGKSPIILSGHFSNWEMAMVGLGKFIGKTASLYRRANNPYMEDWIVKQRGTFMPIQIQKGSAGARQMIELIQQSTPIAGLVDQRLNSGDPIEFLGRATKAPSAMVKLARKYQLPIIMTRITRRPGSPDSAYFKQTFYPVFYTAQTDDMQADIDASMRQIYDHFEDWIKQRPEDWFWAHNRWLD
jgi:KDO2-lipid IV(A) lauroyltransferase